jgi:hypothetical protein
MSLKALSISCVSILALSAFAFGCASPSEDDTDDDQAAVSDTGPSVAAGTFKLYDAPRATPDASCDLHTALTLTAAGKATLKTVLGGTCEIPISIDQRTYNLTAKADSCGALTYTGSLAGRSIEIVDHRKNTCEIPIQALVVVTEISDDIISTLYSLDGQASGDAGTDR